MTMIWVKSAGLSESNEGTRETFIRIYDYLGQSQIVDIPPSKHQEQDFGVHRKIWVTRNFRNINITNYFIS